MLNQTMLNQTALLCADYHYYNENIFYDFATHIIQLGFYLFSLQFVFFRLVM